MTTSSDDIAGYVGQTITDTRGEKIGKLHQLYVDEQTGQPAFATVKTGLFGPANSFVPLQGITRGPDGLTSAWDKEKVKGAPRVEDDGDGYLTPSEEQQLFRYYGVGADEPPVTAGAPSTGAPVVPTADEIPVGTTTPEAGQVRLRKHVVTEMVQITVPVSHEELRVEQIATEGDGIS